jgi:ABC-type branched-subunit amino acid transport system substrate-binding protein
VEAARPEIVKAVGATQGFQGATGEHTFDEYGDTSNKALTVYKATTKEWTPEFSGAFET